MYDLNRPPILPHGIFQNQLFIAYTQTSNKIQSYQRKFCQNNSKLFKNISQQLQKFYNSSWQINSSCQQQFYNFVMLYNLKEHVIFDANNFGISLEHKILYIVFTYFQGLIKSKQPSSVDWRLLNTIFLLTNQDEKFQQIPLSIKFVLNFQYEELLSYLEITYLNKSNSKEKQKLQFLIEMINKKIIQKHLNQEQSNTSIYFSKLYKDHQQKFGNLILNQNKKKSNGKKHWKMEQSSQSRLQIQLLSGIFSCNRDVIEQISKGNWSLYLHFYLEFIHPKPIEGADLKEVVYSYLKKYYKNYSFKLNLVQQYCLNLIAKMPLLQIYQLGFHILSSFANNLVVFQAFNTNISKVQILVNCPEFYITLQNNLLQNAANMDWRVMLNIICIINSKPQEKISQYLIECLMRKYLPIELEKQQDFFSIQQKLKDLKKMKLIYFGQKYLSNLFDFYSKRSFCLTPILLNIFILTIEFTDSSFKGQTFKKMKQFLSVYFKYFQFNFQLLEYLEDLIERKEQSIEQQTIQRIQQMFHVMYKHKQINQEENIQNKASLLYQFLNNKSSKCLTTLEIIRKVLQQIEDFSYLNGKNGFVEHQVDKKFIRNLRVKVIDYLRLWNSIHVFQSNEDLIQEEKRVKKIISQIKDMIM